MESADAAVIAVEREAKLVADAGLVLPDLGGLLPGMTATAMPVRHLDAVYYDTGDLRLARAGVTVRFRTGEPGPPWTVKFPVAEHGQALSRREIRCEGVADLVPEQLSDLVSATVRSRRLLAVARLSTTRLPIEIRAGDGELLAEAVDDTVSVTRRGRPSGGFRELEVETLASGRAAKRLLGAATARLVGAGCVAEPPIPKIIRALGEPATRPPDVVVPVLGPDATPGDLVGRAIAAGLDAIVRHDPGVRLGGDPEDVHRLRVATRRLRSDLRTFTGVLDPYRAAAIRAELAWIGSLIGPVRDGDVLAARLRKHSATLDSADAPGADSLLRQLDAQAQVARAAMLAAMCGTRYRRLLDVLVEAATAPPLAAGLAVADREVTREAAKAVRRPWRNLAEAVKALGPNPSDAALHRVRIKAKRCRYAADAVVPVVGSPASHLATAIAGLQTVLGDHHDTVVAEARLRQAAQADPDARVAAGQLIAVERMLRAELRSRWPDAWNVASARKLRRWL